MKILVTGAAGFIGYHVSEKLLARGEQVVGFDNLNNYYDPKLKSSRLDRLIAYPKFSFVKGELADRKAVETLFAEGKFDRVVHLAAQAGVRNSIQNPHIYVDSNITGTLHVLEGCRHHKVAHLVFASTSSVYGLNTEMPFSVHEGADHPMTLYAATKKANEMMAHSYSHLYGIPVTGLRFFTVYGPWGRPDMALFLFTKAILDGRPVDIFNNGKMVRDFTYVDDIAEGVIRCLDRAPGANNDWDTVTADPATSSAPYRIYNIGNNQPVELIAFIEAIEKELGMKAQKNFLPMQLGDVPATRADVGDLIRDTGFTPSTSVETGVANFVRWYRDYFKV